MRHQTNAFVVEAPDDPFQKIAGHVCALFGGGMKHCGDARLVAFAPRPFRHAARHFALQMLNEVGAEIALSAGRVLQHQEPVYRTGVRRPFDQAIGDSRR